MKQLSSDVLIREATTADADRVAVLSTQLGYPADELVMKRRIQSTQQDAQQILFVAETDGIVVGWLQAFLRVLLMHDAEAEVGGIVVDERFRGRGIGRALMKRAEVWASERKCDSVYLRSNVVRRDAHRFYLNLGYTVVKTQSAFRKVLPQNGGL